MRNDGNFKTAISNVGSSKRQRMYNHQDKADLDIKTSNNLIGDLINVSQELNTLIWHNMNSGASLKDVNDIYMDVCILNVASEIEIDKAKREFSVDSAKELYRLREKYRSYDDEGRMIKPNFFGAKDRTKGYYDSKKNNYKRHDTTMDYLQEVVCKYRSRRTPQESQRAPQKFFSLVNREGYISANAYYAQIDAVIGMVRSYITTMRGIYLSDSFDDSQRQTAYFEARKDLVDYIGKLRMTRNTMICLLSRLDKPAYSDVAKTMFNVLFAYPNESFFNVIESSREPVPYIEECGAGDIELYGIKFTIKYSSPTINK